MNHTQTEGDIFYISCINISFTLTFVTGLYEWSHKSESILSYNWILSIVEP